MLAQRRHPDLAGQLGPQQFGGTRAHRRNRLHQSWYRAVVLDLDRWGHTRLGTEAGSVLHPSDAAAGRNFLNGASYDLFKHRHSQGWGVHPQQTLAHLLSSQALMFNLLGPLVDAPENFALVLASLSSKSIEHISEYQLEYAPLRPSEALGDQTRIDTLIIVNSGNTERVLGLEFKLSEQFSARRGRLDAKPYADLLAGNSIWRSSKIIREDRRLNQLFRTHALLYWYSKAILNTYEPPELLVLHHALDVNTPRTVSLYANCLVEPTLTRALSYEDVTAALRHMEGPTPRGNVAKQFEERYVDLSPSEALWSHLSA